MYRGEREAVRSGGEHGGEQGARGHIQAQAYSRGNLFLHRHIGRERGLK
jgi:hypothetical protein